MKEGSIPLVAGDPVELVENAFEQMFLALQAVLGEDGVWVHLNENHPDVLHRCEDALRNAAMASLIYYPNR